MPLPRCSLLGMCMLQPSLTRNRIKYRQRRGEELGRVWFCLEEVQLQSASST